MNCALYADERLMDFITMYSHVKVRLVRTSSLYFRLGCKGFFRRTILQNAEYVCRTSRGGCDLKAVDHARQRCQKCRIERCYEVGLICVGVRFILIQAGMLEKYVRRKKNRTRTMRILENMKRPTVIVESLTDKQAKMLSEVLNTWNHVTGMSMTHIL